MQKSSKTKTVPEKTIEQSIQKSLRAIELILVGLSFTLESYQPHITGERKIKSLTKMVLIGQNKNGRKVVIKTSRTVPEKKEIKTERRIRNELEMLSRTIANLLVPKEIYFGEKRGWLFFITEFIDQPKIFVAHHLQAQFAMIKKAIESQEMVRLQSFQPTINPSRACPIFTEKEYFAELKQQIGFINKNYRDKKLFQTLAAVKKLFEEKIQLVAKHCGYLVHDDFCPHNFRVNNSQIHFLDYTAANFGNKYITWARLLNYMVLHNPKLEKLILQDFKKNRSPEDLESLRILRIYKTVFLIMYYVQISNQTSGKLFRLTKVRINFWHNFLQKLLQNKTLTSAELKHYLQQRDALRSPEEKKRQKEFAIA